MFFIVWHLPQGKPRLYKVKMWIFVMVLQVCLDFFAREFCSCESDDSLYLVVWL